MPGSKMKIGQTLGTNKEAVGVYYVGNGGTINNNLASFDIGKGSIGIVMLEQVLQQSIIT